MVLIADLHTHSRFAMACSGNITPEGMERTAAQKGIDIIGTGDFTHGVWRREIGELLEPDGARDGLFKVKGSSSAVRFMLSTEVSTVYQQGGRFRKVHHVILVPSFESVDALRDAIKRYGNLDADGRPTLLISAAHLVELVFEAEPNAFLFPAHAWTPHFGVLGSRSGFDSIKEAYEDQHRRIYALETGLSSDPPMNWRVSSLDRYTLVSNSDMHSLQKLGREVNRIDVDTASYGAIIGAIKNKDAKRFLGTVEFYPEEGKYHFDGHRACHYSSDPQAGQSAICRVCGKPLTIGVLHRVEELADREAGFVPANTPHYVHAVPLQEVIAYALGKGVHTKGVVEMYNTLLGSGIGSELEILLSTRIDEIVAHSNDGIGTCINNMRSGNIRIEPGYDGLFGRIDLLGRQEESKHGNNRSGQTTL